LANEPNSPDLASRTTYGCSAADRAHENTVNLDLSIAVFENRFVKSVRFEAKGVSALTRRWDAGDTLRIGA
jgi:hypothetical protein